MLLISRLVAFLFFLFFLNCYYYYLARNRPVYIKLIGLLAQNSPYFFMHVTQEVDVAG